MAAEANKRTLTRTATLLRFLRRAGARGRTRQDLALRLYGTSTYKTCDAVVGLISGLRRRGHPILRVKDAGFVCGRYVLAEDVVVARGHKNQS